MPSFFSVITCSYISQLGEVAYGRLITTHLGEFAINRMDPGKIQVLSYGL
jgi:hypothetical protein